MAKQIPGFCCFFHRLLDFTGEETGDQNDRSAWLNRSPVSVVSFIDCWISLEKKPGINTIVCGEVSHAVFDFWFCQMSASIFPVEAFSERAFSELTF